MERAFVVQFDPVDNTRARLRGQVELVASGEATRFHSPQAIALLLGFVLIDIAGARPSLTRISPFHR